MDQEIIAERVYYLDGKPELPVVRLQLFRPQLSDSDYPKCRYRLVVDGKVTEKDISNVDTVACISFCLIAAGTELAGLNESVFHHALRWEGWSGGADIGLPTIETAPETKALYEEALRWSSERSRQPGK